MPVAKDRFYVQDGSKSGLAVKLDVSNLRAKGGEGRIHIIGDTAYKICDPGKMMSAEKIPELAVLKSPNILCPELLILDSNKQPVGYTMQAAPQGTRPLLQCLSKTFRERPPYFTHKQVHEVVRQMQTGLKFIHSKKCLQVDGNPNNYMIAEDFSQVFFIDVNSFQTPSFPVCTLVSDIRDFTVKCENGIWQWTELSDWYSFALISWWLFTAIHPFRHRHPKFTNGKTSCTEQMQAGISILDPDAEFPMAAVFHPFEDYIPGGKDGSWMRWYREILLNNKRLPPPDDFQAVLAPLVAHVLKQIQTSNKFKIEELKTFAERLVGFYHSGGNEVFITEREIHFRNNVTKSPAERISVTFSDAHVPYAIWVDGTKHLKCKNLATQADVETDNLLVDKVLEYGNRVYILSGQSVYELFVTDSFGKNMLGSNQVARIQSESTEVYDGVLIQQNFSARFVSMFPKSRFQYELNIPELNAYQIIDAKYDDRVLVVVGVNQENESYDRLVFRFDDSHSTYDVRVTNNVLVTDINFTVLPTGIVILITDQENVEVFSRSKSSNTVTSIDDDAIEADMLLSKAGNEARLIRGKSIYSFGMKK